MFYVKWTSNEIKNLEKAKNIKILYTEINVNGNVVREIGLDDSGKVTHKAPFMHDSYGLFDLQVVDTKSLKNDLSQEEFEKLWIS